MCSFICLEASLVYFDNKILPIMVADEISVLMARRLSAVAALKCLLLRTATDRYLQVSKLLGTHLGNNTDKLTIFPHD